MKVWSRFLSKSDAGVWPVVQRELCAASHRASSYWQRVAACGVAFLAFYFLSKSDFPTPSFMGARLFNTVHILLVVLLILMVPFMTADCIAREKREGTLGLLFLTPLTSLGIIIGKSLVQALRVFSIWLAILPILTLPFNMGGVVWMDMINAVVMEMLVAILVLSGGLLASTLAEDRNIALFYSYSFAALLLIGFSIFLGTLNTLFAFLPASFKPDVWNLAQLGSCQILCFNTPQRWGISFLNFLPRVTITHAGWQSEIVTGLIVCLIILWITLRIAAAHIEHTWNDEMSRKSKWWKPLKLGYSFFPNKKEAEGRVLVSTQRMGRTLRITAICLFLVTYFTAWGCGLDIKYASVFWGAIGVSFLFFALLFYLTSIDFIVAISASEKEKLRQKSPVALLRFYVKFFVTAIFGSRRLLNQNPISWLQNYSAKNRLIKWGLFILFLLLSSFYVQQASKTDDSTDFIEIIMLIILGIMYTLSGVNSFWREKQNGGLELLLVTPLSAMQIILGRARGLWTQFLPALLVIAAFHFMVPAKRDPLDYIPIWTIFCTYISLPFFAIYTALRVKYFIVALIITILGIAFSCLFGIIVVTDSEAIMPISVEERVIVSVLGMTAGYAIFIGVTLFLLKHSLSRKIYSF